MAGQQARAEGAADTVTQRRLPAPQAQAFVACRKITNDPQTGEMVIVGHREATGENAAEECERAKHLNPRGIGKADSQ